jgi:hypothetical protein
MSKGTDISALYREFTQALLVDVLAEQAAGPASRGREDTGRREEAPGIQ